MGLFDFFNKSKQIKQLSNEVAELKRFSVNDAAFSNFSFENLKANFNRNIAIYPDLKIRDYATRYTTQDDIYSIVSRLASTAATIPIYGYLVIDDKAVKKLHQIKQPHNKLFETKFLQVKALEDLSDDDPVQNLLDNPGNSSRHEFFEAIYSFLFLFGEAFILKERPTTGVNLGLTTSMHVLFPQHVILKVSDTLPKRVMAYDYRVNGKVVYENIATEDIIHIKYFNPEMDLSGNELRGLSPLAVLKKRLARLDSNMDTTVAQLQNGGVETIVFDKGLPANDVQAAQIVGLRKDNFYRFLRNADNVGVPYFAAGEMGAIQLGLSLANLSVLELANLDFKKLCNVFGTSDVLFNSDSASTESNVQVMERRTYTNTVLPNVYRVRDALKAGLLDEFERGRTITTVNEAGQIEEVEVKGDGKKRDLREDLSEITSLQEDMLKMAQWMNVSPQITYNERRLMQKFDRIDNPLFDEPFIPSGIQLASDLVIEPPIDITSPNGR